MNSRFLFSFRWFDQPFHGRRIFCTGTLHPIKISQCGQLLSRGVFKYVIELFKSFPSRPTLFTKITTISLPQLTGNPVSYRTWKNESTTYRRRSAKKETGVLNFQRRVGRNSVEWRQFCWTPRKNESSAKLCFQCSAMRKSAETGRPLQILHQAENLFLCSLCCQRHYHPARLRLLRCVFRPVVRQRYDFGQFPVKVVSESGG